MGSDAFDFDKGQRAAPTLELEDENPDAPALQLASVPPPSASRPATPSGVDAMPMRSMLEDDGSAALSNAALGLDDAPRAPPPPPSSRGVTIPDAREKQDAFLALPDLEAAKKAEEEALEAAQIGKFGDPPVALLGSIAYALSALKRKKELAAEIIPHQKAAASARMSRGEAYVSLVQQGLDGKGMNHPFQPIAAEVAAYDAAAQEGQAALAQSQQSLESQRTQLKAQRKAVDQAIAEADKALDDANSTFYAAKDAQGRAEGLVKRAEIELRAATEAARQAAGPEAKFAPPEFADRIKGAETALAEKRQALAPLVTAFEQAQKAAWQREDELKSAHRRLAPLESQTKSLEDSAGAQISAQSNVAQAATKARHDAYVQVGRAMVTAKANDIPLEAREAAERADLAAVGVERQVRLHQLALQSADEPTIKRGFMLLGIGAVLVITVLVVVVRFIL